jgi:hypothetical protein
MERIRWIEPVIIYLLFALALSVIVDLMDWEASQKWIVTALISGLLVLQAWYVVGAQRFVISLDSLGIRAFYAPETMAAIRSSFDPDAGERAVSAGLHPGVAINAGIPSADGYWSAYPLRYKRAFRELIAPALDEDQSDARHFDEWGSRAYVFQPDLPRLGSTLCPPEGEPVELVVEVDAFPVLGVTHVISSSEFTNASDLGPTLIDSFERLDELGAIHLHRVD